MNAFVRFFGVAAFSIYAVVYASNVAYSQSIPTADPEKITQKICSFDAVESLLPASSEPGNSPISYLAQQGFTQSSDGSWVCYVNDPKKEGRYYTLLKVQQINGKLVASSFLDQGSLISGQEDRSLDFFMTLVENYTNTTRNNRQSIRKYLQTFISLVRSGQIQASRRGYLFDQPSRSFVMYHPLNAGELKGTGITININSPSNLGSSQVR
ncbi:hypothetical protein OGM63_10605 [Plectonema radiosum NIES-515]|uniref:Uncharacterized protein n=1 Tax=Plectonema radiosum NIES-515 TaxID=2986073 RepID=A0ABT3AXV8_9CYAN|nr:hypothetical protein [Plectonema radiosum]MCV3213959.1 hypothetical protein [Plectonema radiosum NIES-515]